MKTIKEFASSLWLSLLFILTTLVSGTAIVSVIILVALLEALPLIFAIVVGGLLLSTCGAF